MVASPTLRLLAFARDLQRATCFRELMDIAREEVRATLGYEHCWLFVADEEDCREVRLIDISGDRRDVVWELFPVLKVDGDPMLEEIRNGLAPVVVVDARTDARTDKRIVEALGNRTIVNIPLRLTDKPFGAFGCGTFGEEGCRAPSLEEIEILVGMAGLIAVAVGRLRYVEEKARAERQAMETERRLQQFQRVESLGLLAGGIAHDFANLLAVILAGAELAQMRIEDPEARRPIDSVVQAATKARVLTRQLLAMSRVEPIERRPIDMNAQIDEILELFRRVLPASIDVRFDRSPDLPVVDGDGSQLDQVFMNLCVNARDAMPEGGSLILSTDVVDADAAYVLANPWARPGRWVRASVTDTGEGMAAEVRERAFEPFFTTKGHGGTGLGLAVAWGIVRRHGGMLLCHSEQGVGTRLEVLLPVSA